MVKKQIRTPITPREKTDHLDGEATDFKKLPMLGFYEERRSFPRIEYQGTVIISVAGKVMSGSVRTLSAEGIQIRCSPKTARTLHPRGTHITPGKGPVVMLRFNLPIDGLEETFVAEAKLTYITPRSQDEIAFGAQFTHISSRDKKILAAYIVNSMCPK